LFIGVLIIIAAARFTILLASQTHVHSDEAIIGLMTSTISKHPAILPVSKAPKT
jgi:C4-dicarboxylate transporter